MILIFGTSITWGARDEKGGYAQRIKSFSEKKAYTESLKEYTHVYPLGVSGDNTSDLLKRFNAEVEARIRKDDKTLIIIEMGINDSNYFLSENKNSVALDDYKKNLLALIDKSKKHNADLIFLGLTPVDERVNPVPWRPEIAYKMEFVQRYEDVLKNVCENQNIPLIETMSKFLRNDLKSLLADGLHPNTKGHELIYHEVLTYLKEKNYI